MFQLEHEQLSGCKYIVHCCVTVCFLANFPIDLVVKVNNTGSLAFLVKMVSNVKCMADYHKVKNYELN
jgi:hypothetical protein